MNSVSQPRLNFLCDKCLDYSYLLPKFASKEPIKQTPLVGNCSFVSSIKTRRGGTLGGIYQVLYPVSCLNWKWTKRSVESWWDMLATFSMTTSLCMYSKTSNYYFSKTLLNKGSSYGQEGFYTFQWNGYTFWITSTDETLQNKTIGLPGILYLYQS